MLSKEIHAEVTELPLMLSLQIHLLVRSNGWKPMWPGYCCSISNFLAQINWYANASGGTALGTGTSFTTPSISVQLFSMLMPEQDVIVQEYR